ncbi:MFS transporter [Microtetraspora malaysiensis]|uniref:MFS transporter n=1 Tax=Microtetraspora malaysiensis TaxID=161358 RepID=UPI00083047A9|nr:MFS transporter [Microtetraspora malaysiensis]
MSFQAYRRALALPRVRFTIALMFLARLPMTAMGILLTLHVVSDLNRGFTEAGLVGAASVLAGALAAPAMGRMLDRHGLRRVVAVCGTCSAAFWISMPHLPYPALLVLAAPASALAVPAQSLTRQFLTALVPEDQRRAVFSLDIILGEASFIVGPALAVVAMTQISSTGALTGIGVWLGLVAVVLSVTNLPIRSGAEQKVTDPADRPRMLAWLNGRIVGSLIITAGSMFALIGTEVAVIATMKSHDQTAWTGTVIAAMSIASIIGGLVHGAVRRSLPQGSLAVLLCALLVPVGLFGHAWWVLAIALVPMNLMCTPALAAGTEAISRLAPAQVRGEAIGLLSTATGLGMALGNPVVGFAIDHTSAGWGFAVAGLGGLFLAAAGVLLDRGTNLRTSTDPVAKEGVA